MGPGFQGGFKHGCFPSFQVRVALGGQPFDDPGRFEFSFDLVFGVFFTACS